MAAEELETAGLVGSSDLQRGFQDVVSAQPTIPRRSREWTHVCSAEWTLGVRGHESRRRFIHGVHRGAPRIAE